MAELREGRRGLGGFAVEHFPRDSPAEQDPARHQEEPREEIQRAVQRAGRGELPAA